MNSKNHSIIGIVLCTLLLIGSMVIGDGRTLMFNLEGLVVVIAGTLGATFISYPFNTLRVAVRVAVNSYKTKVPSAKEIVDSLLHLSLLSKIDGLLALEEGEERASVLFLKRALSMLVDGFSVDELRDALYTEIHFFQQRRSLQERVFRHMAILAPAFGVAGGVIGLVGMLAGIGDTGIILRTIPVALTSTLYGIILAYFVCIPIAENIHARTQEELLIHKLIAEGVSLIGQEYNTMRLQTRLQSFITPHERDIQNMSIKEIRDKYEELKNSRLER
jgi:chemotaxis protein MotA